MWTPMSDTTTIKMQDAKSGQCNRDTFEEEPGNLPRLLIYKALGNQRRLGHNNSMRQDQSSLIELVD
jgi:hypothetical protein